MKKMTKKQIINLICNILMVIFFLISISCLIYPIIFDTLNRQEQHRTIVSYDNRLSGMEEDEKATLLAEAEEYNARLRNEHFRLTQTDEKLEDYMSRFNVGSDGIMGHLSIPVIDVSLMIYHTVEEPVLQIAVGHLPGTAFPIGGLGNHTVLSGHRGLTTAALFTDLDKLEIGDVFYIYVMEDILTYEVDQIKTVQPNETDDLEPDPNQDYCTLLTCTPYGVNSHRLLVRGHRVETPESLYQKDGEYGTYILEEPETTKTGLPMEKIMAVLGGILLIGEGVMLTAGLIKKKRNKKQN